VCVCVCVHVCMSMQSTAYIVASTTWLLFQDRFCTQHKSTDEFILHVDLDLTHAQLPSNINMRASSRLKIPA
jgi:hypothetical protein